MDAVAEAETEQDEIAAASRRGPMRPQRLVSSRANRSKRLASHLFRGVDLVVLTVVTVVVTAARLDPVDGYLGVSIGAVLPMVVGAPVLARAMRSLSLYRFGRSERLVVHVARVLLAGLTAATIALLVDRWAGDHGPSASTCQVWAVSATGAVLVLHVGWWSVVRAWRRGGWLVPNVVVVGATEHAERLIAEALQRRHVNVLGVFDDRLSRAPDAVLGVPVLGNIETLITHRITPFVDLIVVAVDPEATRRVREIAAKLAVLPNEVTLVVEPDGSSARRAVIDRLDESPLATLSGATDLERKAFAKRLQDLLVSVPVLILISPLLAVVALLVKLDSRGPVFFRQRRHGFNNEEIVVWKFRTMRTETTDARAEQQVTANDVRVTRVGRILRATSLDELPQLINVVRGEMSLVGPRPHAIGMKTGEVESARLVAEYAHRHRMKPGMTGWAAINGSRGPLHEPEEVQRRVALDVDYIARQSFWLDVWIMVMTVPSLLGDRSAVR